MNKREFFDDLAPAWEAEHRADTEEARLLRALERIPIAAGERVLDVGCGSGRLIPHVRRSVGPAGSIVAADFSSGMLRQAAARAAANGAVLLQADVHSLPLAAGSFDLIIGLGLFPHLAEPAAALREFRRVLGSGRRIALAHNLGREEVNALHARAGGPIGRDLLPPPSGMKTLLEAAGFRDIDVIDEPSLYIAKATAA